MLTEKILVLTTIFVGCLAPWVEAEKAIVCYMVAWAVGRPGEGKFSVLDADTEHCTHVIYAFMGLDESTNEVKNIDPYIDLSMNGRGQNQLAKLKQLKKINPNLKVLASIGGWNEAGKKFSDMARSAEKRDTFIRSVVTFLRQYELDGLDICWQFPGQRGGRPEDKRNSLVLFKELKNAFRPEGWLLTVHILAKRYIMDGYNIRAISEHVDFINLAAVEYSGPWELTTGVIAPLRAKNELSVTFSVDYMLSKGAPPSKLLLGLPLYGHAYVLKEPPKDKYIGLFSDKTFSSQWTNEYGISGFHETCYNLKNEDGWTEVWDSESQTPLAYNGKKFMSFDNKRSLLLKADLVESRGLGGVMFWSLDMDDFRGLCYGNKYPLVSAISGYVNQNITGDSVTTPLIEMLKEDDIRTATNEIPPVETTSSNRVQQEEVSPTAPPQVELLRAPDDVDKDDGDHRIARSTSGSKTIVCYIAAWSAGRSGGGKFSVSNADTAHCTHIIYAFMTIDSATNEIKSVNSEFDRTELPKLAKLKRSNPSLKVLVSVGGWGQGSKRFSDMAASPAKRQSFIDSVMKFINDHQLNGIDLCWQFPTQRGGIIQDKENSLILFREMKMAFRSGGYLLTVHVLGRRYVVDSYDIKAVSDVVDYINFATVEYNGPWNDERLISATTPLYSSDESNVKSSVDIILQKGVPPEKILLGLAAYGHAYILAEQPRGKYLGIRFVSTVPSQWTNEPGLMAYNEVCYEKANNEGWQEYWEDLSLTPIAYQDKLLVSYDNAKSLRLKAKLVNEKQLGGVMFWSLDMDDFHGLCGDKKYPLLSSVATYINKSNQHLSNVSTETGSDSKRSPDTNSHVVNYEYGRH